MPVLYSPGIEATRQLADQASSGPRVLVLTTFDLDEYVYDALRAGASGFLLKDVTAEQLFDAVRVIAAGDALLAPGITRRLIGEFAGRTTSTPQPTPALDELTLARHKSCGSSPRGCPIQRSQGDSWSPRKPSKTHVSHVLNKLGLRDPTQAVVIAYESGLVTPGSQASKIGPSGPS